MNLQIMPSVMLKLSAQNEIKKVAKNLPSYLGGEDISVRRMTPVVELS